MDQENFQAALDEIERLYQLLDEAERERDFYRIETVNLKRWLNSYKKKKWWQR
jgi:hypothetical protein